jgi:hypothetical protein
MSKKHLFFVAAWAFAIQVSAAPTHAGYAGKDPACVRDCGSELAHCLEPCRSGRNCPRECASDPLNYASCISVCEDEIQLCEGLCREYNDSCLESCPEMASSR